MNTTEKYIYQVYLEKSFSKAAKSLFISQPSLSAAVAHKERELGFSIFDRTTKPISLTARGHIYIEMLEEIFESENHMRLRVQKLSDEMHNAIAIGGGSSSAYYLMPSICGAFHHRYGDVEVRLDIGNFGADSSLSGRFTLYQKLDRRELDAVFSYEYDANKYAGHKIHRERLVVAMHKNLVPPPLIPYAVTRQALLTGSYSPEKTVTDRSLFSGIPFLDYLKNSNSGRYMGELLGDYTVAPYTITNARHGVVHYNMMCAGVGALLTGDIVIALSNVDSEDIFYFVFDEEISTRQIYLVTRKNTPLNRNTQNFINVAKEICSRGLPLSLYNE